MSFETIVQLSIVQKPNYVYGAEKNNDLTVLSKKMINSKKVINLEEKKSCNGREKQFTISNFKSETVFK